MDFTKTITKERVLQIQKLNEIAKQRGQTLAQMALAWLLRDKRVTSVLVGASSAAQLQDSLKCLNNINFDKAALDTIEIILKGN